MKMLSDPIVGNPFERCQHGRWSASSRRTRRRASANSHDQTNPPAAPDVVGRRAPPWENGRVDLPMSARSASSLTLAVDTNILIRRHVDDFTVELFGLHESGMVNLQKTDTL